MKLPNADLVKVEREKITEYLLNAGHRYGASKARFFAKIRIQFGCVGDAGPGATGTRAAMRSE